MTKKKNIDEIRDELIELRVNRGYKDFWRFTLDDSHECTVECPKDCYEKELAAELQEERKSRHARAQLFNIPVDIDYYKRIASHTGPFAPFFSGEGVLINDDEEYTSEVEIEEEWPVLVRQDVMGVYSKLDGRWWITPLTKEQVYREAKKEGIDIYEDKE